MILGDADIKQFVEDGILNISPFTVRQLNPNSYDLRIGDKLKTYIRRFHNSVLDCKKDNPTDEFYFDDEIGYILEPGKVYLAQTKEEIHLKGDAKPSICATLMGKSSLGRLGLDVHISAGFIDTGFKGKIVLELRVEEPLKIYAGMPIAQLKFEMSTPVAQPYDVKRNSKYNNQQEIVASKMYQNF